MADTFHSATDRRCKTSALEQEILAKLAELGLDLVPQVKRRSWVFDAGVQGTKILIEVNGDFWHSQPHAQARDERKATWAQQYGYTIISIWEGEYHADPDGMLLKVLDSVEQARTYAPKVDTVDTEAPMSSYTFDDWRDEFIAALSGSANVRQACHAAQISRAAAYKRRDTDVEFAAAWDEAVENACDLLEGVYWSRAREQSDRAVEFILKAKRAAIYGKPAQVEMTGKNSGPLESVAMTLDEWKAQAATRIADASATLAQLDADSDA